MTDRPCFTLLFNLPDNFDAMSRETQGRLIIHHFQQIGQKVCPSLTAVTCQYYGAGDSWEGANWHFFGKDDSALDVEFELGSSVAELVDLFVDQWVSDHHPGWENNDGGFGTVLFDLIEPAIRLDHHENYSESRHAGTYYAWTPEDEKP